MDGAMSEGHGGTRPPYDDAVEYPSLTGVPEGAPNPEDYPEDRPPPDPGTEEYWMPEQTMLSLVQREIDSSLGWTGTRLAEARRQTLSQYFGNPRGDEREGRSQVVTRDVFEQVEWLLPSLMEIFCSGPQTARFLPVGDEDKDSADQATATVNHVFNREDGFMVLYTMFKDALTQKNGVAKVWWEESAQATHEDYFGKDLFELQKIVDDPDYEIRAVRAWRISPVTGEREEFDQESDIPEQHDPMLMRYDVEGVRYNRNGKVAIDNVPPEEFIINRDARGLEHPTCRFVGHRVRTSESQLIAWGYDAELVRRLPGSQSVYTTDQDAIVRASQDDSFPLVYSSRQDSERTIYITECYILLDRDGDGISEWWKVVTGGDYAQSLLHAEPSNGHPFVSVTPIPVPHRFYGLSLGDVTGDLQEINTTLWRQFLNCTYLATDPRTIVYSRGEGDEATPMANLTQLLNAAPGAYIEEYEKGALRPFETKSNAQEILPAFEVHSKMKENRTGISPEAMGINPDSISKHVYGTMVQSSAAATRTTLYARIFADTGVKNLFEKIYKVLMQNDTRGMTIRLRGEYVRVDPTSWSNEADCQVTVGLGHGSKMEKSMNLQTIGQVQEKLVEVGLPQMVTPDNVFNLVSDLVDGLGFRSAEQYFTDPGTVPPAPPPEDPAADAVRGTLEVEFMKVELGRQKVELERDKLMMEIKKMELDHEIDVQKLRADGYPAATDMPFDVQPPGAASQRAAPVAPPAPPPGSAPTGGPV